MVLQVIYFFVFVSGILGGDIGQDRSGESSQDINNLPQKVRLIYNITMVLKKAAICER